MTDQELKSDIGFVVTKAPSESGLVSNVLSIARSSMDQGKSVGLFLISDGVWLAKKNQKNHFIDTFTGILKDGAAVIASGEHLEAAGIPEDDVMDGVIVTKKLYKDLVANVMENWDRVMTI